MISWLKQLKISFGVSFLWLVCLIYFTQGFRSFVWTAVSYQLKDKLELTPSVSQFVTSIAFFPWSIKPIYGIISDCIPIKGRKRIPYLVLATFFSLFPWLILGLSSFLRNSKVQFTILLTLQNIGSAMADVVIDAMIAEAVRSERASFAGDLQSVSWMSMALGGICGSLLGGFALNNLEIEGIFLFFSVLPAVQLFSCFLVEENAVSDKDPSELSTAEKSLIKGVSIDEDKISSVKFNKSTSRQRKNRQNTRETVVTSKMQISDKEKSVGATLFKSLKIAAHKLFMAFKQPIILRPMTWFFLALVTSPNISTIMFYYQTEYLKLDASFLGTTRVVGWLGLMLGTLVYNRYLKKMKLRRILLLAQVGISVLSLLDMVLVSRVHLSFGISDKIMVLFGSALSDGINQFKFMPFLILSGQLCPPGIEGTLFALFMSINNLGSTLGSFLGAGMASLLNISSGSYDNFLLGIAIYFLCTFIPIAVLFLIPKEATGISA
ncbi:transporter [Lithospermum erythrorhizon]|uniref:Transporter n=1 Tax=Lithospermum erythrorhizon TaxID=34254 RepID=A0AAV3PLW5_LITER